ncbi:esterase [Roseateles violae]|uniref:Esterase n=1 Tax=Roseateles violae TaxID=3058042 RepID=A0ABT8DLV7_9BURK|nr:esterase [Pelomonas sp. PFR6]MDN3918893.1 esterase [Pelomonas sp. PFR6]
MNATSDSRAIVSLPAGGQAANLLFLLFHGVGAQAAQMAPLAAALREQYPQAAIVSLNGPDPFDGVPGGGAGFQWFSIQGVDETNRAERVAAALPAFIARIRSWAAHFGLEWGRVALAGFSQGAIMALEAVQAEPQLAGRVIAVGGRYASLPQQAPQDVCVHLLHGMTDQVLPYRDIVSAAQQLVMLGADVTADVLPAIGHELHPELVAKAMLQLRTFVPAKLWAEAMKAAPKD